jgi:hypothetical protein
MNTSMLTLDKNRSYLLAGFILIKLLLEYTLIHPVYDLQRDEFLHLDQAHHLAWGYTSIPPFTSWISWIIYALGNSIFWVKFFPALFGILTTVLVWKTVETLKGNLFALVLAATAITFSSITRLNTLFQPNSFDVLSWTLVYFLLVKYINTYKGQWLWMLGIAFAFGFLNKYNILFLILGTLPALLLTRERQIFLKKELYLAILLALVLISPNLYWQYHENFPVLRHMEELARTQLIHVNRLDFLKEQIFYFLGSIFVLFAAIGSLALYKPFRPYRFVLFSFLFTMLLFIYFRAKGYYAIGLYPVLLAFGAVYLSDLTDRGWKRYLRPVCVVIPVLMFIPIAKRSFPIYTPEQLANSALRTKQFHRWEDGKEYLLEQDFADMLGWRELAGKVDSIYNTVPDKSRLIVFCDNYGEAGAINFYKKTKTINAMAFNADYINWYNVQHPVDIIIRIKGPDDGDPKRMEGEHRLFQEVILTGKIDNKYAREYGTEIYLLRKPKEDIKLFLEKERQALLKADGL